MFGSNCAKVSDPDVLPGRGLSPVDEEGPWCRSVEKHEPVSDIDTVVGG